MVKLVLMPRVESLVGRSVFSIDGPCQSAFAPARRGVVTEDDEDRFGRRVMVRWEGEDEDERCSPKEQPVRRIGTYLA